MVNISKKKLVWRKKDFQSNLKTGDINYIKRHEIIIDQNLYIIKETRINKSNHDKNQITLNIY